MPQEERPFQLKMIERKRRTPLVKPRTFFTDSYIPDSPHHHVNEDNGYYVVGESESAIFYSEIADSEGVLLISAVTTFFKLISIIVEIVVELVVLRGIASNSPLGPEIHRWLSNVVEIACNYRRNVRVSYNLPELFSVSYTI